MRKYIALLVLVLSAGGVQAQTACPVKSVSNQYSQQANRYINTDAGARSNADYSENRAASGTYGTSSTQTLGHELAHQVPQGQSRVVSSGGQTQSYSPSAQPNMTKTTPSSGAKGDGNA